MPVAMMLPIWKKICIEQRKKLLQQVGNPSDSNANAANNSVRSVAATNDTLRQVETVRRHETCWEAATDTKANEQPKECQHAQALAHS